MQVQNHRENEFKNDFSKMGQNVTTRRVFGRPGLICPSTKAGSLFEGLLLNIAYEANWHKLGSGYRGSGNSIGICVERVNASPKSSRK